MADNIFTKTYNLLNASLDKQLETLTKREEPLEKRINDKGEVARRGLIFDPFVENSNNQGLFRPKVGYITNALLKQTARRAPAAAIIINTRSTQVLDFCRPQADRSDVGFKFNPRDKQTQPNAEEVALLNELITNCGVKENRAHSDKLTFDQFGHMIAKDMLRYGHCAIEKIPALEEGRIAAFLPLPADTIYYSNKKMSASVIHKQRNIWRAQADEKSSDQTAEAPSEIEYVQVIDNKVQEEFAQEDLIFWKLNNDTDTDLMGYAISPLETALSMVTAQMQIENHQRAFFTHGVASRGILVIQGDMTPNQLRTLQSQWTQQTTGPLNAWRTPVLAGIKGVQWVPLTAGNRDMEYAAYQDHVLRVIHACFAIDPEETGFGYLSKGTEQRSMGESSNEYKILASQSKGLRPILSRIEAMINEEVLPSLIPELADKYEFCFVGLDAETALEETERLTAEVSLHTTLDEARSQAELEPMSAGGGLILNPLLLQTLQANMYKGQFMETFLGIQGASQNPDLQYIPDPFWFQWQQTQMQMMQQQAMAQDPNAPQDPNNPSSEEKAPPKKDEGEGSGQSDVAAQQALAEQQQAQMDAQGQAAQQYISANPHLFKAMKNNLSADKINNLRKSENRPNDKHVDEMYSKLMGDYDSASQKLMQEVMSALKEDLVKHECGPDCKDHK